MGVAVTQYRGRTTQRGVVEDDRSSEAPVDPLDRIDEIIAMVEAARSVPMSRTNFMFDRGEMIAIMDELRAELPGDLRRAAALLEERDKIIDAGKREADRIISEGETEHARLVSVNEITVSAEHEGARIISEARAEAQRLREEVDDYVDTALRNFEQFLTRALASIERGRDKMHALREIGTFVGEENERPLPF
jgi:vacuolar-type H+-ATPase subunit H